MLVLELSTLLLTAGVTPHSSVNFIDTVLPVTQTPLQLLVEDDSGEDEAPPEGDEWMLPEGEEPSWSD